MMGANQNDVLVVGIGNDWARGGGGSFNTFRFESADGYTIIEDFVGRFGENIDLSHILEGYDSGASDVNDFVRFRVEGDKVLMDVDLDGPAMQHDFRVLAELLTGKIVREENTRGLSQKRMTQAVELNAECMIASTWPTSCGAGVVPGSLVLD